MIWVKEGMQDQQMLKELKQMAEGYDSWGNRISHMDQLEAITRYRAISAEKDRLVAEQQRAAADTARAAADAERAKAERQKADAESLRAETDAEVARRRVQVDEDRLRLEAIQFTERLKTERAEVFVKLLAVAINGGVDHEKLLTSVQNFSQKLLPETAAITTLLLEKKG